MLSTSTGDAAAVWLEPALPDYVMQAVLRIKGVTVVASTRASNHLDPRVHGEQLKVEAVLVTRLEKNHPVAHP